MPWQHPTAADHDHRRDQRKHYPRPGDRGFEAPAAEPPARLNVDIPPSIEIALLVRDPAVSLKSAADLIEQYARTRASEATADAVLETGNRLIAAIDPRLARKEPA